MQNQIALSMGGFTDTILFCHIIINSTLVAVADLRLNSEIFKKSCPGTYIGDTRFLHVSVQI